MICMYMSHITNGSVPGIDDYVVVTEKEEEEAFV